MTLTLHNAFMSSPLYLGPTIVTRYVGATDHKPSRIVATLKRDNETTYRAVVSYQTGHEETADKQSLPVAGDVERSRHWRAVSALLARQPFSERLIPVACGHDRDAYFWICVCPYQLENGALAALNIQEDQA